MKMNLSGHIKLSKIGFYSCTIDWTKLIQGIRSFTFIGDPYVVGQSANHISFFELGA